MKKLVLLIVAGLAVLAVVLFVIILVLTLIVQATARRWVYYEGAQPR